jgi:hypothetical protein
VRVLWLLRWCSARFRGWRLSDRRTWREGVLSLKHRRRNETKKYHPAQQSPHENNWLPGNENPHGRTSGDEERLTITTIILRKTPGAFLRTLCLSWKTWNVPQFVLANIPQDYLSESALRTRVEIPCCARISTISLPASCFLRLTTERSSAVKYFSSAISTEAQSFFKSA